MVPNLRVLKSELKKYLDSPKGREVLSDVFRIPFLPC